MKSKPVLLFALTILLGGCADYPASATERLGKDLGLRATKWGNLRAYALAPGRLETLNTAAIRMADELRDQTPMLEGKTVLYVLVGVDGIPRDADVVESSGDKRVDRAAQVEFAGTRYPAIRGRTEPYVIQIAYRYEKRLGSPSSPVEFYSYYPQVSRE